MTSIGFNDSPTESDVNEAVAAYLQEFDFSQASLDDFYLQVDLLEVFGDAFSDIGKSFEVLIGLMDSFEDSFQKSTYAYLLLPRLLDAMRDLFAGTLRGYIEKDSLSEEKIEKIHDFFKSCAQFAGTLDPIDNNLIKLLLPYGRISKKELTDRLRSCEELFDECVLTWKAENGDQDASLELVFQMIQRLIDRSEVERYNNSEFSRLLKSYIHSDGGRSELVDLLSFAGRNNREMPYELYAHLCPENSTFDFLRSYSPRKTNRHLL